MLLFSSAVYRFAIHVQSFVSGVVTDDLAAKYPDAIHGLLSIGLPIVPLVA